MSGDYLDQIPVDPLAGIPQALFSAYRKKEITKRECHVGNADWIAKNLSQYRTRLYPPIPDGLRAYISSRIHGHREYDRVFSGKLGVWVQTLVRLKDENDANMSLFLWAIEQLDGVGLAKSVENLNNAVVTLSKLQFQFEIFSQACRVQALDARERTARGNRE